MTLCRAQGETPCKKKAELQTSLKLVATLWKQEKISGACLEEFIFSHHVVPREQLYVPKESSFTYEANKNQFGQFEREQYRRTLWNKWNIVMKIGVDPRDSES